LAVGKIKLHNIFHSSGQALLNLLLEERKAEFLPSIFYALREEGIPISFIVQLIAHNGSFILSLTTAQHYLNWVQAALQEGLDLSRSTTLRVQDNVTLITLYGPHLGEIPGIASRILSALVTDGVEVLAMSASLNSSLLVIPQESLAKSLRSLNRICEIPKK